MYTPFDPDRNTTPRQRAERVISARVLSIIDGFTDDQRDALFDLLWSMQEPGHYRNTLFRDAALVEGWARSEVPKPVWRPLVQHRVAVGDVPSLTDRQLLLLPGIGRARLQQ